MTTCTRTKLLRADVPETLTAGAAWRSGVITVSAAPRWGSAVRAERMLRVTRSRGVPMMRSAAAARAPAVRRLFRDRLQHTLTLNTGSTHTQHWLIAHSTLALHRLNTGSTHTQHWLNAHSTLALLTFNTGSTPTQHWLYAHSTLAQRTLNTLTVIDDYKTGQ